MLYLKRGSISDAFTNIYVPVIVWDQFNLGEHSKMIRIFKLAITSMALVFVSSAQSSEVCFVNHTAVPINTAWAFDPNNPYHRQHDKIIGMNGQNCVDLKITVSEALSESPETGGYAYYHINETDVEPSKVVTNGKLAQTIETWNRAGEALWVHDPAIGKMSTCFGYCGTESAERPPYPTVFVGESLTGDSEGTEVYLRPMVEGDDGIYWLQFFGTP